MSVKNFKWDKALIKNRKESAIASFDKSAACAGDKHVFAPHHPQPEPRLEQRQLSWQHGDRHDLRVNSGAILNAIK